MNLLEYFLYLSEKTI